MVYPVNLYHCDIKDLLIVERKSRVAKRIYRIEYLAKIFLVFKAFTVLRPGVRDKRSSVCSGGSLSWSRVCFYGEVHLPCPTARLASISGFYFLVEDFRHTGQTLRHLADS